MTRIDNISISICSAEEGVGNDSFFHTFCRREWFISQASEQASLLAQQMGFSLVECTISGKGSGMSVSVVLYKPEGVSIADCSRYHKALLPRLEALMNNRDVVISVSSPGLTRQIKNKKEYSVFVGRGLKLLSNTDNKWHGGIIQDVSDNSLTLKTKDGDFTINLASIQKARLDYTEEAS